MHVFGHPHIRPCRLHSDIVSTFFPPLSLLPQHKPVLDNIANRLAPHRQLRTALRVLDEQSMATTRRLDDTYYSILEKVASLHGTIGGLQELSTLTKRLRAGFAADAAELVDEVDGSLDGIGDFAAQARLLEEFEARIAAGKERAARLNERLDAARKRVDERERMEEEWRTSVNRKSFAVFWVLHL